MSGQSQKDDDSSDNNVWDDSLLIQSYDKSVKLARKALAKKIARATNKNNKIESSDRGADATTPTSQEPGQVVTFKAGDYVRATYEDGVDYEARIVSIDESREECLLKYVGYENEQTAKLADLIPSWGKKTRRKQCEEAEKGAKKEEAADGTNRGVQNGPATFGRLPPPPPMPPNLTVEDSEHLSAMLMSWYMSGYYTGFYYGQKTQKLPRRK